VEGLLPAMEKRAEMSGICEGWVSQLAAGAAYLARFQGRGRSRSPIQAIQQRYPGGRVWKEKNRRQEMPSGSALVADGMMIQG
jgi:hypothetical protein